MTQNARIISKLREPGWHPGPSFGRDYRELSARISELNKRGWDIKSRKSRTCRTEDGRALQEYRLGNIV